MGGGGRGNNPVILKGPFIGYRRAQCLETALICFTKVTKRQAKVTERQVFSAEPHSGHHFSGKGQNGSSLRASPFLRKKSSGCLLLDQGGLADALPSGHGLPLPGTSTLLIMQGGLIGLFEISNAQDMCVSRKSLEVLTRC